MKCNHIFTIVWLSYAWFLVCTNAWVAESDSVCRGITRVKTDRQVVSNRERHRSRHTEKCVYMYIYISTPKIVASFLCQSLSLLHMCACMCAHTHTLSHIHSRSLSLTNTYTHTLSLSLTHTHTLSPTHTHTHSLSLSNSHTYTLSLSHSRSLSHTHTFSLSHTHTHTLSLSPTQKNTTHPESSFRPSKSGVCRAIFQEHST